VFDAQRHVRQIEINIGPLARMALRVKFKPMVLLGETKWHLQLLLILAH
jgi:hypothetical protein